MPETNSLPQDYADYVDIDGALARLRGNKKIVKTLLQTFLKNDTLNTLKTEMAAGNTDAAVMAAHTIKGMAGNLSLTALYNSSVALEAALKAGESADADAYEALWDKTRDYVNLVIAAIDADAV